MTKSDIRPGENKMTKDEPNKDMALSGSDKNSEGKVVGAKRISMTTFFMVVALSLLVIGSIVFKLMGKRPEKLPGSVSVSVAVVSEEVKVSDVEEVITYAGRVEADADVSLAVDQMGNVAWLGCEKGSAVTNGQLMLRLDNRSQAVAVQRAEVSLRQAKDDMNRFEELRKSGSVSDSDFDNIKTRKELAAIALQDAMTYLAKCEVISPINGIVEERMVDVGEFVSPGMPVFRVVDVEKVKVIVNVPERDIAGLVAGRDVKFIVDAMAGRIFEGKALFVSPAADVKSNTFRVEIGVQNPGHLLKPGFIARISLTRRILKDALSVPLHCLVPSKGQYIAFLIKDGHAVRRIVKLESISGERAVVGEGLGAGDRVIVEGHRHVSDGVAVSESAKAPSE
jgi:membrane fusion protein (multidrug efflux system)